ALLVGLIIINILRSREGMNTALGQLDLNGSSLTGDAVGVEHEEHIVTGQGDTRFIGDLGLAGLAVLAGRGRGRGRLASDVDWDTALVRVDGVRDGSETDEGAAVDSRVTLEMDRVAKCDSAVLVSDD